MQRGQQFAYNYQQLKKLFVLGANLPMAALDDQI